MTVESERTCKGGRAYGAGRERELDRGVAQLNKWEIVEIGMLRRREKGETAML